ncbi:endonuclease/exonuclease/phosphatase family protein [Bacteriovorax sp. BSW11_IV]|uniref:endonuclease/exonuclease/phosphatase n=1 Tax=Bacteriovorax sp. BSW11_IV TaxID=1353529 RepID=UPI00038A3BEA|nr:endonuclease/exonuclease/phosphatase [Bacteriovorax sp. BSW11_IV]EQC48571.1 endonuclease/exonuclease/phosphatase family protein [Bacteriovorax sp. BSW11_IV]
MVYVFTKFANGLCSGYCRRPITRRELIKFLALQLIILCFSNVVLGFDAFDDFAERIDFSQECERNAEYVSEVDYSVDCGLYYHHYNSQSYNYSYLTNSNSKVRIGSWNVFHPGIGKTQFKDFKLVAKILNQWDVVTVQELLPLIGDDLRHNEAVLGLLDDGPWQLKKLTDKLSTLNPGTKVYERTKKSIDDLKADLKEAKTLYRSPGYLQILNELRKIDPSWALIISPNPEGTEGSFINELVGFYYRATSVRPTVNEHCSEFRETKSFPAFACYPEFSSKFMYKNYEGLFSRKPFMASFQSGNFDFVLMGTHIIFNSPSDEELMGKILSKVFGVESYDELGAGVDSKNYARYAEVKMTLDFIRKFKKTYKEQDFILGGDFNIEYNEPLIKSILAKYNGINFLMEEPTSLANKRYVVGGVDSEGYSKNFDHFILFNETDKECRSGGEYHLNRIDFYSGEILDYMKENYIVRNVGRYDRLAPDYEMTASGKKIYQKAMKKYEEELKAMRTIKRGKIVFENTSVQSKLETFERRVFLNQLSDDTFYGVYQEIISDHVPIDLSCNTSFRDDD